MMANHTNKHARKHTHSKTTTMAKHFKFVHFWLNVNWEAAIVAAAEATASVATQHQQQGCADTMKQT